MNYNIILLFYIFRAGLSLGASKHWSETLEILTGTRKVTAKPLLEYFDPLYKFLKRENENNDFSKANAGVDIKKVGICLIIGFKIYKIFVYR